MYTAFKDSLSKQIETQLLKLYIPVFSFIEEDNHILYLRSVTKDKIILWYNKREIHLDKEIEIK